MTCMDGPDPTLAVEAPAEWAGLTDKRAPGPWPQGPCPALVRAAQQRPRDDMHQLPDHSPCALGAPGQAIGGEEKGFQLVRQLPQVSRWAPGTTTAVNQLTVLRQERGRHRSHKLGGKSLHACRAGHEPLGTGLNGCAISSLHQALGLRDPLRAGRSLQVRCTDTWQPGAMAQVAEQDSNHTP